MLHKENHLKICLFDPSLLDSEGNLSKNLGDLIIAEAVKRELNLLFPKSEIIPIHTHTAISQSDIKIAQNCSLIFVGGSNILGTNKTQWPLTLIQKMQLARLIMFGTGWYRYEEDQVKGQKPYFLRYIKHRFFLNTMLSSQFCQSVRDDYSEKKLKSIGFKNVINTGCPTMWPFVNINTLETIPQKKADNVLVTLTDYNKFPELDRKLLELISNNYEKVFFFPQGSGDLAYISSINVNVNILERSLDSLNQLLNSGLGLDYIGTRLHGGIKCLLNQKRSLILEIDNRATEIAINTGLPTCKRSDFAYINNWINNPSTTNIKMNTKAINQWKSQFENLDYPYSGQSEKRFQRQLAEQIVSKISQN